MDGSPLWNDLYKIMSDSVWQSVGVILGAAGVYWGALLGSSKGQRLAKKQQEADLKRTFDNYIISFEAELKANLECLYDLNRYVYPNHPPILEAFLPLRIGADHLRSEVWESMLKLGLMKFFTYEEFRRLSLANHNILRAARVIQIYSANWDRVLAFRKWEAAHKIPLTVDLRLAIDSISNEVRQSVEYSLETTKEAIEIISPKLLL